MANQGNTTATEPSVVEAVSALATESSGPDIAGMPWITEGTNFAYRIGVRLLLTEPFLGTVPMSPEVFADHIATKLRKELLKKDLSPELRKQYEERLVSASREETETVPESEEKGHTSFMVDEDGHLFIMEYMIRGFLKAAAEAIKVPFNKNFNKYRLMAWSRECEAHLANKGKKKDLPVKPKPVKAIPWAHKKMVDESIFTFPRHIHFLRDGERMKEPDGVLERPLRAETPKGPRVALAKSDQVDAGTEMQFEIAVVDDALVPKDMLVSLLKYGAQKGLGQFRNGGYGRFVFKVWDIA